jgi:hypothetical protein
VNRRAFGRALALSCGALGSFAAAPARGAELTAAERNALARGEVVSRPVDADLDAGFYIGGVAYAVVHAPAPFVLGLLHDPAVYQQILSLTLEAKPVGHKGDDLLVYFKHGGDLGTAGYTMRVRFADSEGVVRFWMDPAFDHEIEDVWGYLRVEALGPEECLATYAILCDLGTILRVVFGERIREYALETPGNLKNLAEPRHRATLASPFVD